MGGFFGTRKWNSLEVRCFILAKDLLTSPLNHTWWWCISVHPLLGCSNIRNKAPLLHSATATTPRHLQHFSCTCHQRCLRHSSAVGHLWVSSFPWAGPGALEPNFQIFDPNTKSLREGEKRGQFPGRFPSQTPPKYQWDLFSGIHSTEPWHHKLREVLHLWQMALTFGQCCWERSGTIHTQTNIWMSKLLSALTDRHQTAQFDLCPEPLIPTVH